MRTAVVTIARGRGRHLERQSLAVARMDPAPDVYVVVDLDVDARTVPGAHTVHRPVNDSEAIPLAAARNTAIAAVDADLVVCLDADCIPERGMLTELVHAARVTRGEALLAGPVGRLSALPPEQDAPGDERFAAARAAARRGPRPVPASGAIVLEPRVELFWSLSFAVTPEVHERIGGFDAGYAGYGAEDTDYAFAARKRNLPLYWVGGAWAHHQHHDVSDPPIEHLEAIIRNAGRFHGKWGRWPMQGWLRAFADAGLIRWGPEQLEVTGTASG